MQLQIRKDLPIAMYFLAMGWIIWGSNPIKAKRLLSLPN
jgi:hypothetical protein